MVGEKEATDLELASEFDSTGGVDIRLFGRLVALVFIMADQLDVCFPFVVWREVMARL